MSTHNHDDNRLTIGCPECINARDFAALAETVTYIADTEPNCADDIDAIRFLCAKSPTFHTAAHRTRHLWPNHLATHIPQPDDGDNDD